MPARGSKNQAAEKVAAKDVPRKAATIPKRRRPSTGKSVVRKWKDGSGEVRVGRTVVDLMTGETDYPPEMWTDEELLRGAPKSTARPPHVIPMVVYNELIRRVMSEVRHRFAAELEVAVDAHIKLIRNKKTPPQVRMVAIRELYDRVLGKPTEHVAIMTDGDAPWMKLMATAIVGNEAQAQEVEGKKEIVEAEVVEGEVVDES